jgi:hypothetical protein
MRMTEPDEKTKAVEMLREAMQRGKERKDSLSDPIRRATIQCLVDKARGGASPAASEADQRILLLTKILAEAIEECPATDMRAIDGACAYFRSLPGTKLSPEDYRVFSLFLEASNTGQSAAASGGEQRCFRLRGLLDNIHAMGIPMDAQITDAVCEILRFASYGGEGYNLAKEYLDSALK